MWELQPQTSNQSHYHLPQTFVSGTNWVTLTLPLTIFGLQPPLCSPQLIWISLLKLPPITGISSLATLKRQPQFLYYLYYLTVKALSPSLNYIFLSGLPATHCRQCLSNSFSPFCLYLALARCLFFTTLITTRRWHSLLRHYSRHIQQMRGLMKCPHRAAPWFITYFCHSARADNSFSTPLAATT